MIDLFRAAVLGALQGATEFLPVSSSAHLIIVPALLGWPIPTLAFDTSVHVATALAAILHFRSTWTSLLSGAARALGGAAVSTSRDARVLLLLVVATLPAAAAGFFFEDFFGRMFQMPRLAAWTLFITAILLVVAERFHGRERRVEGLGVARAAVIGIGQAISIVPGISRSGATIASGQLCGLDRSSATKFSFLMAPPILLGAGAFEILQFAGAAPSNNDWAAIAVGTAVSFVVGYATIGWLLDFVGRRNLVPFAIYTAILGAIGLVLFPAPPH